MTWPEWLDIIEELWPHFRDRGYSRDGMLHAICNEELKVMLNRWYEDLPLDDSDDPPADEPWRKP